MNKEDKLDRNKSEEAILNETSKQIITSLKRQQRSFWII